MGPGGKGGESAKGLPKPSPSPGASHPGPLENWPGEVPGRPAGPPRGRPGGAPRRAEKGLPEPPSQRGGVQTSLRNIFFAPLSSEIVLFCWRGLPGPPLWGSFLGLVFGFRTFFPGQFLAPLMGKNVHVCNLLLFSLHYPNRFFRHPYRTERVFCVVFGRSRRCSREGPGRALSGEFPAPLQENVLSNRAPGVYIERLASDFCHPSRTKRPPPETAESPPPGV